MSIKIKVEKVLDQGEQNYLIKEITALPREELPARYLMGNPQSYLDGNTLTITDEEGERYWLRVDREYPPSALNSRLEILSEAGQRLREINLKLKEENADWHGEETFII